MSNQKGGVSPVLVVVLGMLSILILLAGSVVISYVSASNAGNRMEVSLETTWTNNQNVLGQYTLKLQEVASVPDMYKNDLKEIVSAEMSGRYGAQGSKANMQWIQEHSQNFDSSMYTKIQQVIESGRNEFQNDQTRLLDEKRVYQTQLGSVWTGFWLHAAGYPKVDLAKYKPVVAQDTAKAFETGVQGPVKLR